MATPPPKRHPVLVVHANTVALGSLALQPLENTVRIPRTVAMVSGFFGGLALMLSMIGLYGIMSYTVGRRRNEIGVRLALGAARTRIIGMVLGETGRMVLLGVAIGLGVSLGAGRLVSSFLHGVTPTDPTTFAVSMLVLTAVAIGAAVIPARRAARMDPVSALRDE